MSRGPLSAVLEAVDAGALTSTEIAGRTGLSMDMIRASLEQLVRMHYLTSEALATACPPSGCGGCSSASAATGTCATGPVLVGLSRTRRAS
jgi:hypothetical protein